MWIITKEAIYRGMIILGASLLVGGSLLLTKEHLEFAEDAEAFANRMYRMFSLLDDEKHAIANAAATAVGE